MKIAATKEELFESYYNKCYKLVVNYITKKIQNAQDAEDLAMECFAKCYDNFDKFDESKASFQTWLFVIVNNKIKNYYRDKKVGEELDEALESEEQLEQTVVDAMYLSDMRKVLSQALLALNETQREIIIMKYYKNMTSVEIAEKMSMTAVNVRVTTTRAMTALRDYFSKNNIELEF